MQETKISNLGKHCPNNNEHLTSIKVSYMLQTHLVYLLWSRQKHWQSIQLLSQQRYKLWYLVQQYGQRHCNSECWSVHCQSWKRDHWWRHMIPSDNLQKQPIKIFSFSYYKASYEGLWMLPHYCKHTMIVELQETSQKPQQKPHTYKWALCLKAASIQKR